MSDNAPLAQRHCTPLAGVPPMNAGEVNAHLAQVSGWQLVNGALEKTVDFPNYHGTMDFVNAVAYIAHREDHHPDLAVSYSRCVVRFNTHSVGGISINDFICAARVDALLT